MNIQNKKYFKITSELRTEGHQCLVDNFYFTYAEHIFNFLDYGNYLREVILPVNDPDFKMIMNKNGDGWIANKIIFGKRYDLDDIDTFEYLFSLGTDIHSNNNCAVQWAAGKGYLNIVKYLILSGADICSDNNYALKLAVASDQKNVVDFLVKLFKKID